MFHEQLFDHLWHRSNIIIGTVSFLFYCNLYQKVINRDKMIDLNTIVLIFKTIFYVNAADLKSL